MTSPVVDASVVAVAISPEPWDAAAVPYFQPPHSGPRCSTPRSARLRQRRFDMRYRDCPEPAAYTTLAEAAKNVLLAAEAEDLSLARAKAMAHVVAHCPLTLEKDAFLIGGESPFLFNVMLPALNADAYQRSRPGAFFGSAMKAMQAGQLFSGPCFEGHITPGLEFVLGQGIEGLRWRVEESRRRLPAAGSGRPRPCGRRRRRAAEWRRGKPR